MFDKLLRLAAIIGTLPVTLTNGTVADATQVMSDLNWIVNQVNANAAPMSNTALLNATNNFTAVQSGIGAGAQANFPIAGQVQNSAFNTLSSALGTNAITARVAALPLSAWATGQVFTLVPSQTNNGPANITVDAAGSAIVFYNGAPTVGGELQIGLQALFVRDAGRLNLINNAALGSYVESVVSGVIFPAAGTFGDLTSLPLGSGNWEVTYMVDVAGSAAAVSAWQMGVSTTAGNSSTGLVFGKNRMQAMGPTSAFDSSLTVAGFNISGPATLFGKVVGAYTLNTPNASARLSARRWQ